MTRRPIGRSSRFLSGYCLVVAQNDDGRIKLFGSPADHASVEVGDEIIEINGRMLSDVTHEEVVTHIHESIKSRRVSLKVRRRKGRRLVDEFPSYCIQNAYIVSSDDQVHPRTDFIPTKNGTIVLPTDMASLVDNDEAVSTQVDVQQEQQQQPDNDQIDIPAATLNVGICLSKPSSPDSAHSSSQSPSPSPEVDFIRPISAHKHHLSVEDLLQRTLRNIDTCIQLSKAHEGLYFDIPSSFEERPTLYPFPLASEENSRISSSLQSSDSACDMGTQIHYNSSTAAHHREMAVDVPDQFLGAVRGPLRYPINATDMAIPSPAMLEAEKIKRHHAEAVRRREEDEQRIKRDEFLRTSLRNSKRLKALEKSSRMAQPPGFYNAAFEDEQFMREGPSSVVGDPSGVEMFEVPDAQSMKRALEHISAVLKRDNSEFTEELSFIESLFNSRAFHNAADLHNLIERRQLQMTEPVSADADQLTNNVLKLLPYSPASQEVQELRAILSTPEFKQFILAHDELAKETIKLAQFNHVNSQSNDETGQSNHLFNQANINSSLDGSSSFNSDAPTVPVGGEAVSQSQSMPDNSGSSAYPPMQLQYNGLDMPRIVRIEKNADTFLGATIRIDEANGSVIIARIVHGGAAQKSGLLHEGDELLEVNSIELRGRSLDEVSELLARMVGTLTFMILPGQHSLDMPPRRDYALHVRANFDYDPENDPYVEALQCPCEKLGLSFRKRDILHILNRDDKCWWQANRDGEEVGSVLAGLIPSTDHQQRRHDYLVREDSFKNARAGRGKRDTISSKRFSGKKLDKSKKKRPVINGSPLDLGVGEVPWYEEVALFYPKPGHRRPIVLLGPAHMGRKELLEKLIASDPDRFAKPVSHTTRPAKPGEVHNHEYHFVTKHQFDGMVLQHQFVEFGVFERHTYGTSIPAINDVIAKGKVCLLVVEPSAVATLRASNFKPFVVLIVPPPLDMLQHNRMKMGVPADELTVRRIIEDAQDIEETYGHFIDLVIENTDEASTFSYLLSEINRLEREAQWVPAEWIR